MRRMNSMFDGAPRRVGSDALHVFVDRLLHCRVVPTTVADGRRVTAPRYRSDRRACLRSPKAPPADLRAAAPCRRSAPAETGFQAVRSRMPPRLRFFERRHQRVRPEAQREIENDGSVLDEHVGIAPRGDRPRVACRRRLRGHRRWHRRRPTCRWGTSARRPTSTTRPRRSALRDARQLRRSEPLETDFVAGPELAHLPKLGLHDRHRADKAAE